MTPNMRGRTELFVFYVWENRIEEEGEERNEKHFRGQTLFGYLGAIFFCP